MSAEETASVVTILTTISMKSNFPLLHSSFQNRYKKQVNEVALNSQ
jgi:hypothetical protein